MATIREHNKTIDGVTYTVKTLPTTKALFLMPRIVALFGDGIVELVLASDEMPDVEEPETDDDGNPIAPGVSSKQAMARAIGKIVAAIGKPSNLAMVMAKVAETAADPDGIFKGNGLAVLKDMMQGVTADKVMVGASEPIPGDVYQWYDEHFAGRLKHLMTVCVWVGQVNFFGPSAANP